MNRKIDRRAIEIYLSGHGTLKDAYEQAKREILKNDITSSAKDLFGDVFGQ